ncbi:GGDEF domain-containing protein [Mesorhizobium sp. BAC0120]|uniref:GGDEF domain-containing protein n=1 Tax=Mesorhizobium sp. BAC0120 TaxID=3090670 RepID=UPI00298C1B12|nr:GGDEF domain-containing protein [Mesorhizobium sp. BAC0120]MDW6026635.1 GGDEF domain-containing protein [Mesorhizobium sp. BAC0120]
MGTAISLAFSLLVNYLLLFSDSLTAFVRSVIGAAVLPIMIGAPLSLALGYCLQEIRRQRRELTHSASHDRVTAFFNSSAFASVVDLRAAAKPKAGPRQGAFLIINADNLRAINMRYGFGWGEEALRLIAATIRSSVRSEDIVGRLGPGEFGIFLPGASENNARSVGERIRAGVAGVYFAPNQSVETGDQGMLSVRVAGVMFEDALEFQELYRVAEQHLSGTQEAGEVAIARMPGNPSAGQEQRPAH